MEEIKKQIETSFKKSKFIDFKAIRNQPSIVTLIFDNETDGVKGYELLLNLRKTSDTITVIIKKKESKVDLTIVLKETADAINIDNLNYSETQLNNFKSEDDAFVLAIGMHIDENKKVGIIPTRNPIEFVIIGDFKII